MKAVFVIDVSNDLDVNDLLIDYCVHTKGEYKPIRKGGNHPLKPLPKGITEYDVRVSYDYDAYYAEGWNDCLDEITGETE